MTPIQRIVAFVNEADRPLWWRHCVRLVLSKNELSETDINLLYEVGQMEFGLKEKNDKFEEYTSPVSSDGFETEQSTVALASIGPLDNVSSLLPDQILSFEAAGMTVIYGDNGAGKSSYSKVLKNACLTRGELPVVTSNVFSEGENFGDPSAVIKYCVDAGDTEEFIWSGSAEELTHLKSIRVFDSSSAIHYVSKEEALEYKPAGLNILDELSKACAVIQEQVDEQKGAVEASNSCPAISDQTKAGEFVKQINCNTDPNELEVHCGKSEEIEALDSTRAKLHELQSKTPEQIRTNLISAKKRLQPLIDTINSLIGVTGDDALLTLKTDYEDYKTKVASAEALRTTTLSELPLDNIGGSLWKTMWDAAESFVLKDNKGISFPPEQGDSCPLCLQKIGEPANKRLENFRQYVKDQTLREAEEAKARFAGRIVKGARLNFDLSAYEAVLEEIETIEDGITSRILEMVQALKKRKDEVGNSEPVFDESSLDLSPFHFLTSCLSKLDKQLEEVKSDDEIVKAIDTHVKEVAEIEARKIIADNKELFKSEIQKRVDLKRLGELGSTTTTQAITRLGTQINLETVTGKLIGAFEQELVKLGFKFYQVKANTRGARGSQLFKISLDNANTRDVTKIASEGEQKCLALASFLAEIHADDRKSAVIFDDPVNSLDHRWRRKFAKRLAEEAEQRQVIVFTHDITFLKMLDEATENKTNARALVRQGSFSGKVLERPPWDTLKTRTRIGALKQEAVHLRKLFNEASDDIYSAGVKHFYGKKRETWERLVEEALIFEVVQRFDRRIQTQRLRHLVDIQQEDLDTIETAMTKCSTFLEGHDNASELGIDIPDPDELDADLKALETYFKGLQKRRR